MNDEAPNIAYGRLLESAHLSGYGFERMTGELEWLLEGDRWQTVGTGYTNVNDFLRSVDLSAFNLVDKKRLHQRIKELQPTASNYAIGEATGASEATVRRDTAPASSDAPTLDDTTSDKVEPPAPASSDAPVHVTQNTGEIEWYTPAEIIEAARTVLGTIDLDPASSPVANATVRATHYYTIDDDGLARPWTGRIWLNPPYSTGLVDRFVKRIVDDYENGDVTAAVVLTNNATDTRWWQQRAASACAVCFVAGRIRFLAPDGERNTPLQGQTICYLGDFHEAFAEAFDTIGAVR